MKLVRLESARGNAGFTCISINPLSRKGTRKESLIEGIHSEPRIENIK